MTNPSEPTLTCSEVVERLAKCAGIEYEGILGSDMVPVSRASFDRTKAEAILHSWRERRVQELEKCLREIALALKVGQGVGVAETCRLYAENTLANSEWREQIRKGAKHESDL